MRLETAAAKFDRKVAKALPNGYDLNAADMRELLLEAAKEIKHLEHLLAAAKTNYWNYNKDPCGND